ncbi:MAG: hypothetical protein J2P27_03570 [Actinobacteria bacterium]|nr:hypothetical protein [Actinomycetota bacterium]
MPGKNRNPLVGWHPPADVAQWLRDEAERRGVSRTVILNEAMAEYIAVVSFRREHAELTGGGSGQNP